MSQIGENKGGQGHRVSQNSANSVLGLNLIGISIPVAHYLFTSLQLDIAHI